MDTVYSRKIAEIVLRDEQDYELRRMAARAIEARKIRKKDRRELKKWMLAWCDRIEAADRLLRRAGDSNC